jgi:membrane-associated protease RseP (regulator of RpoE activity)
VTSPLVHPETPPLDSWPPRVDFVELPPPTQPRDRYGLPSILFLMTALSVYLTGGVWLVASLLPILIAHEMGHYLMCRYYGVSATVPFFIPAPILSFVGTLGAFIRIRSPFPDRRALFDIGIAGPLLGFVVCLPMLIFGLLEAEVVPYQPGARGLIYMGEPLLFQWAAQVAFGRLPDNLTLGIGPVGLGAWFGLFVTALNMMPIGQLDGGHVTYALLRGRAQIVSRLALAACLVLAYLRPTWLLWAVLLTVLMRRPHPATLDDQAPLGRGRVLVGILGFAVFAVCFTPSPFIITWGQLGEALLVGLTGLPITSR